MDAKVQEKILKLAQALRAEETSREAIRMTKAAQVLLAAKGLHILRAKAL